MLRAVFDGARFELDPRGRVLRAAWGEEDSRSSDSGGHEVGEWLGGGFLRFAPSTSRTTRIFWSRAFTGPLEVVADLRVAVLGARNAPSQVVLHTDRGPVGFDPRTKRFVPIATPGLHDVAAVHAKLAAALDLGGNATVSNDGGNSWLDARARMGTSPTLIGSSAETLWFETPRSWALVRPDGGVAVLDSRERRPARNWNQAFEVRLDPFAPRVNRFAPSLAGEAYQQVPPLGALVLDAAVLPNGTVLGVYEGTRVQIDPATGDVLGVWTGDLPPYSSCRVMLGDASGPEPEVLYACSTSFEGEVAVVLRGRGTSSPRIERTFGRNGFVMAEGAIAYRGGCADPVGRRSPHHWYEPVRLPPRLCLRRGADSWADREIDLEPDDELLGWAIDRDGRAAAVVHATKTPPLPPSDAERTLVQGGVRVVRTRVVGWQSALDFSDGSENARFDQRLTLDPGGDSVLGWVRDESAPWRPELPTGATLSLDGNARFFELPAYTKAVVSTGRLGLAIDHDGNLSETFDHGRSWRRAGRSPVPPWMGDGGGEGCGPVGCTMGRIARVGWGVSAAEVRVEPEPPSEPLLPALSRSTLTCSPAGPPTPLGPRRSGRELRTTWGDPIVVERPEGEPEPRSRPPPPPLRLSASAAASASAAPSSSAARPAPPKPTRSGRYRPLFSLDPEPARFDATNLPEGQSRGTGVTPLVDAKGNVTYLLQPGGEHDVLLDGESLRPHPAESTGWRQVPTAGVRTSADLAVVLGRASSSSQYEVSWRGLGQRPLPFVAPPEHTYRSARPLTVTIRADGQLGFLALDGPPRFDASLAPLAFQSGLGGFARAGSLHRALPASSPDCRSNPQAHLGLVEATVSSWLDLSESGVDLPLDDRSTDWVLAAWSPDRVCVRALRASVNAGHRGSGVLVVRFDGPKPGAAVFRNSQASFPLSCTIKPPVSP